MSCPKSSKVSIDGGTLAAASITEVFIPTTGWMSTNQVGSFRGYGELRGKTGNFQCRPGVQLCNDPRNPSAANPIGSVITADGCLDASAYTTVSTVAARYMRFGWLVSLTSGSTLGTGFVTGAVEYTVGS
jgi:hypothetical protein